MIELSESRIDKRQVKTLLRAAFKTDLRGSSNPMNMAGNQSTKFPPLFGVILFQGFIGLGMAAFTFAVKNPFMTSLIVYSAMAIFLSITILLEFSNLILNPDEYQIAAPLPIGSKTFFVTKLIHLLAYVNILGSVFYLPSAVTVSIANQNLLLFFSFSLAGLLAATTIGMVFVVLYTLILKIVNRETMQRVSGYVQLGLISLFYFGFFVAPRLIPRESLEILADSIWLYLAPTAWFSAIAKLPAGGIKAIDLCASFVGIIVLFMFFRAGLSRLSLSYARTLSSTVAQRGQLKRKQKWGLIARLTLAVSSHEDRAVWKLIRKQFKYDNRFKMSILVIIPLTALYVYMGIADGKPTVDPFTVSFGRNAGKTNLLLYMAVIMLPFLVTVNTSFSESYRSAWVFFTSPADRTRIVLSSARFALTYFCFPFTILLAGLFTWLFGDYIHALLHSLFLFVLLMILTKSMVLIYPRIPFSQTQKAGQSTAIFFFMMLVGLPIAMVPMIVVSNIGYGGYHGYAIYLLSGLILNFVLQWLLKKTIPKRMARLEFSAPI
jgi:ABC-2 type transport system permease protein